MWVLGVGGGGGGCYHSVRVGLEVCSVSHFKHEGGHLSACASTYELVDAWMIMCRRPMLPVFSAGGSVPHAAAQQTRPMHHDSKLLCSKHEVCVRTCRPGLHWRPLSCIGQGAHLILLGRNAHEARPSLIGI
jgi:hypothetical protein